MKLKQVIFFFLIVASVNVFAQKRSLTELADEAFENKQYITAVDLYKEAYNAIADKYDENTEDAAARAFMVEATTKQLKNSIGDNIYKKYSKELFTIYNSLESVMEKIAHETFKNIKRKKGVIIPLHSQILWPFQPLPLLYYFCNWITH